MKNESITTTTVLIAFNILLVLVGLLMMNKKIINSDEKSDSLQTKINQIESQLDVLIDDTKNAKEKVIVANKDFIQLSNTSSLGELESVQRINVSTLEASTLATVRPYDVRYISINNDTPIFLKVNKSSKFVEI